mmetsp:Transcript_17069/g.47954  ORF Transcript_17069/g.47954 Transcript_17069/m.47954 type:complete len:507 (-) Transcript_17069:554-2074(-)
MNLPFFFVGASAILFLGSLAGATKSTSDRHHLRKNHRNEGRLGDAFAFESTSTSDHTIALDDGLSHYHQRHAKKGKIVFSGAKSKKSNNIVENGVDLETIEGRFEVMKSVFAFNDRVTTLEFAMETTDFSDPDALPALQDFLEAEGMCFTGTSDFVTDACGSECCVGEDACVWNHTATVCVGSCMESGACEEIRPSSVILPFSCIGKEACLKLGLTVGKDGPQSFVQVGPKSCIFRYSCEFAASEGGGNNKVLIKPESCIEQDACDRIGKSAKGDVIVGRKSCIGKSACDRIGQPTEDSVIVGNNSCLGHRACDDFGREVQNFAVIGDDSCVGSRACQRAGGNRNGAIEYAAVGSNACVGNFTCFFLGSNAVEFVTIGDDTCLGDEACFDLGKFASNNVTVGDASCVEKQACYRVGHGEEEDDMLGSVSVGNNACTGEQICFKFGQNVTDDGDVSIATGACADASDACGINTVGGDDCDASNCTDGQSFSMPANEQSCASLCIGGP